MSIRQLQLAWLFIEGFVASKLRGPDERGSGTVEKVVLAAIAVAAALAAGAIIYNLAVDEANEIDTTFEP